MHGSFAESDFTLDQPVLPQSQHTGLQMSDAIAEARENVKFLATMDKSLGPLYSASPRELRDALPALFSALHMLQAASK